MTEPEQDRMDVWMASANLGVRRALSLKDEVALLRESNRKLKDLLRRIQPEDCLTPYGETSEECQHCLIEAGLKL